jgi:hypothetical protein
MGCGIYHGVFPENFELNNNDNAYYSLIKNIRNIMSLTPDEIRYVEKLHTKNLIEIIMIQQQVIDTLKECAN